MFAYHSISGPNDTAFVFADHASNHIPDWVGDFGLSDEDLARHIAWDIGTDWVARALCEQLSCAGLICGFSRLVIDANRDPAADDLIPLSTDGTVIPGNADLSIPEAQERKQRLYDAYHTALGDALDDRPDCFAISIHSFTPQLRGHPKRPTDIGLLVKVDSETPVAFIRNMAEIAPELQVDVNEPYSGFDLNHTVDHNVVPRGLRHLAIELRQDHISTKADAVRMAGRLARAIRPLI
ncbi:N-formylglutamate amidohydrolase [Algimonas arctica]|uniref:N-formylglutamate amidohydrolase n=1 Tax=Algimonas arctica TaxID=1479486 RepID=A0A8J3G336_9PROT|nr:N-formylglutamate amidohydrolase [Algimonas arctica]GHB00844.1 N-formylglutamate amidohydrolase [Algimonas arctica]